MLVAKDRVSFRFGCSQLTRRINSRPVAAGRPFHCGCASITRAPLCAGVKGLAVVFLGAVFGVGSGVWPRK